MAKPQTEKTALRSDKRDMIIRPPLDECGNSHETIYYDRARPCPLCRVRNYLDVIEDGVQKINVMHTYLGGTFFSKRK